MSDAGDSGLGSQVGMPPIRVRTIAASRRGRLVRARTLAEFEQGLGQVAWFARLGEPSPWDGRCVRISGWEQWPGPENALGEAFAEASAELQDAILGTGSPADSDLRLLFDRVQAAVLDRARTAVPFDSGQDAWHAPTACVWEAAYAAALIACVLARNWPVPEDLVELWNWFEAGHWPSGFASEPGDVPGDRNGKDLVFPRRLLVY